MSNSTDSGNSKPSSGGGIGFGLFLLLAGVVLLAQQMGYIPKSIDWLFPAILIAWGASELYRRRGS